MKYILAQDKSNYSLWQIETLLKNLLGLGVSITDIYVLLGSYGYNKRYKALYRAFRGVNFVEYRNLTDLNYSPAVKPYLLWQFFKDNQYLESSQWMLLDCDVILNKPPELDKGTVWVSDCSGYMDSKYLDSCGYTTKDFADYLNIDVDVIDRIDANIGGAQYVFDNIPHQVWEWSYNSLYGFRKRISEANKTGTNPNGFQRWASEMFTNIYSLSLNGCTIRHSKQLEFNFATDSIEDVKPIIHNAGVTDSNPLGLFKKGDYTYFEPPNDLEINENYVSYLYYNAVKDRKW